MGRRATDPAATETRADDPLRSAVRRGRVPMAWTTGELTDSATGAQKEPDLNNTLVHAGP